jgi:DNA-directed RNA polymerase subunit RPC12/RpoP
VERGNERKPRSVRGNACIAMVIVVLEDVYLTMQNYIRPNTHAGVINGNLKYSCPNCSSESTLPFKNNNRTIKRLMECKDCGSVHEISNQLKIT